LDDRLPGVLCYVLRTLAPDGAKQVVVKPVLLILFFVFVVLMDEANAARRSPQWHWGWGWGNYHRARQVRVKQPRRTIVKERTKVVIVDCKEIADAVKTLDPDRLEKTLRKTTDRQRQIIKRCTEQHGDGFFKFFGPK